MRFLRKCAKACKMDVDVTKTPDHTECIRCGMCVRACPTKAVSFRYGFCKGKEDGCPAGEAERRNRRTGRRQQRQKQKRKKSKSEAVFSGREFCALAVGVTAIPASRNRPKLPRQKERNGHNNESNQKF